MTSLTFFPLKHIPTSDSPRQLTASEAMLFNQQDNDIRPAASNSWEVALADVPGHVLLSYSSVGRSSGWVLPLHEVGVPNLTDMDIEELTAFYGRHHEGRYARLLFDVPPEGALRITKDLAHYAMNNLVAKRLRLNGDVATAQSYERICQSIYEGLPKFARW